MGKKITEAEQHKEIDDLRMKIRQETDDKKIDQLLEQLKNRKKCFSQYNSRNEKKNTKEEEGANKEEATQEDGRGQFCATKREVVL